ncbi:MAG: TonB-dependent receptor [Betaproteobacteria bacterium]
MLGTPYRSACMLSLLFAHNAIAQQTVSEQEIVVTATRVPMASAAAPASIDRVNVKALREGLPLIDASEVLNRVPGLVVQNRQNFAQDTQISSRGFGARATFGIRGLKLFVDDIPASIPDGQGQGAIIPLFAVDNIEVLRGPWAVPFGNAAGGVISAHSLKPVAQPFIETSFAAGQDATRIATLQAGAGTTDGAAFAGRIAVQRFTSDGFRAHSRVEREQTYARLDLDTGNGNRLMLVGNLIHQPDTQDPLGLSQAQFAADARQAPVAAIQFNTRKSIEHRQLGVVYEGGSGVLTWKLTGYGGNRDVEQFLSTPVASQAPAGSAGGVVSLDRQFHGAGFSVTSAMGNWSWTAGAEMDKAAENRRGFENFIGSGATQVLGVRGKLRRDELNEQHDLDSYVYADWAFAPSWKAHAALRSNHIEFQSSDYYIATGNGDDSGSRKYQRLTPAVALVHTLTPSTSIYASASSGFETPTAAELAYRPDRAGGLNFDLAASTNRQYEAGIKYRRQSSALTAAFNFAGFAVETDDEIVPATSTAGRSTFQNGGRTARRGIESSADVQFPDSAVAVRLTYTLLQATFRDGYQVLDTGGRLIVPGALIPGIPRHQAFAEISWRRGLPGLQAAVEYQARSRVAADDGNSAFAGGYGVVNFRAAYKARINMIELLPYVRVENVFDRKYAASVIVNDSNQRYFESAPTRRWLAGVNASLKF